MIRPPSLRITSHKADQGGAPVYAYLFTWEPPVAPGLILANHTVEIPFVFHNIEKSVMTIGDSDEALALQERMGRAWVNFAGTGDPNADGLPEWPVFDRDSGATMWFDDELVVGYHHDQELLALLAPEYL